MLADELQQLGATDTVANDGGVTFMGDMEVAYRANLYSRIATRVLLQVAEFPYRNEHEIYDTALLLPWPSWFSVDRTIKVEVTAHKSPVKSLDFTTLKIKDAVCDKFREVVNKRPSVATRDPDVRIYAHLDATTATLYLDLSGAPLFKRGKRDHVGEAPLKKNLAAGIIALTGWQPDEVFFDPMCGSGTFLVEAAEMACRIAPAWSGGVLRHFAFEKLRDFDAALWKRLCDEARANERSRNIAHVFGSDLFGDQLKIARENLVANGLGDSVALKQANVLEVPAPAEAGVLVTNPPYGERLSDADSLREMYPKLGDALKQRFAGWRAYFFSG
ncbi:MAG: THUMP domain-containing protein, partial [Nitrosomonadaceae bacterium]|nr:THUMP domain-containing protein [Nitrosomonadaceae bacterium]